MFGSFADQITPPRTANFPSKKVVLYHSMHTFFFFLSKGSVKMICIHNYMRNMKWMIRWMYNLTTSTKGKSSITYVMNNIRKQWVLPQINLQVALYCVECRSSDLANQTMRLITPSLSPSLLPELECFQRILWGSLAVHVTVGMTPHCFVRRSSSLHHKHFITYPVVEYNDKYAYGFFLMSANVIHLNSYFTQKAYGYFFRLSLSDIFLSSGFCWNVIFSAPQLGWPLKL